MINYIATHTSELLQILTATVFLARLIVKLTPTPRDDSALDKAINFLKHVGLHIEHKE